MLLVNAPLKRDYIIELINEKEYEDITFKLVKQEGMKIYFEHNSQDEEKAKKILKSTIKKSKFGSALYFNVEII